MIIKPKLIYIVIIVVFVLLTGGIKYSHITWLSQGQVSCYEEEIRIFGFYYKKVQSERLNISEGDFGWRFSPSHKIFSINKMIKY